MTYRLERLMHLTHPPGHPDAKAVEVDDPEGHYVLGGAGVEIPEEDAKRYGLVKDVPKAEGKAMDAPPEDKAVHRAAKK